MRTLIEERLCQLYFISSRTTGSVTDVDSDAALAREIFKFENGNVALFDSGAVNKVRRWFTPNELAFDRLPRAVVDFHYLFGMRAGFGVIADLTDYIV